MYTIEENNLVLRVPLKTKRFNPYEADSTDNYIGEEMDNIVGIYDSTLSQCGFGYWIDMSYKGGGDQNTNIFFTWEGSHNDFTNFCRRNNIEIIEFRHFA